MQAILSYGGAVEFTIKPLDKNGEIIELCWATIFENGKEVDYIAVDKTKGLLFTLEYDKNVQVKIEAKDYTSLEMDIDTRVPDDVKKYTYQSMFSFYLIETKEGFDVSYSGPAPHPVIKFNQPKDRFSNTVAYNPSYTYAPKKAKEEPKPEPVADESLKEKVDDSSPTVESDQEHPKDKEIVSETEEEVTTSPKENLREEEPPNVAEKPSQTENTITKKPIKDNYTPAIERSAQSKKLQNEMMQEQFRQEEQQMKDRETRARSKRHFLEEVSDSRKTLKQQERNYQP